MTQFANLFLSVLKLLTTVLDPTLTRYMTGATTRFLTRDKTRHSRNPDLFLAVGFLSLYYGSRSNPDAQYVMPNDTI